MKKGLVRFLTVLIAVAAVFSAFNTAFACPHFDINNDHYMIQYNTLGRPQSYIYFYDYYVREIFVDPEKAVSADYDPYASLLDLNTIKEHIYYEKYKLYLYETAYPPTVNIFDYIKVNKVIDETTKVVPISHNYYTLNVPVGKIYKEAYEKKSPLVLTVLYSVSATDLNAKHNKTEYDKAKNAVKNSKYNDLGYKLLQVKPYIDYSTGMEGQDEVALDTFPEEITVTMKLEGLSVANGSSLTAVLIDDKNYTVTELGGSFKAADNTFTFKATKGGIYTVVSKESPVTSNPPVSSTGPSTSSSSPSPSSQNPSSSESSAPVSSEGASSEEASSGEEVSSEESEIGAGSESESGDGTASEEPSSGENSEVSEPSTKPGGGVSGKVVAAVVAIALLLVGAAGLVLYLVKYKKD